MGDRTCRLVCTTFACTSALLIHAAIGDRINRVFGRLCARGDIYSAGYGAGYDRGYGDGRRVALSPAERC